MKSLFPFRLFAAAPEDADTPPVLHLAGTLHPVATSAFLAPTPEETETSTSPLLKTVAWVTAGAGAIAIGLVLGRELRNRYKFNRRTPYDFYAHAGDEQDLEFGVGI